MHKGRIDVEGMVEDPLMTVVFTVLYELGEPVNLKDRKVGHCRLGVVQFYDRFPSFGVDFTSRRQVFIYAFVGQNCFNSWS